MNSPFHQRGTTTCIQSSALTHFHICNVCDKRFTRRDLMYTGRCNSCSSACLVCFNCYRTGGCKIIQAKHKAECGSYFTGFRADSWWKFPLSQQEEEEVQIIITDLERPHDEIASSTTVSLPEETIHTEAQKSLTKLADSYRDWVTKPTNLAGSEASSTPTEGYYSRTAQPRQVVHDNTGTSQGSNTAHIFHAERLPLLPWELEGIAAVDALVDQPPDLQGLGSSQSPNQSSASSHTISAEDLAVYGIAAQDHSVAGTTQKSDEDARAEGGNRETKVQGSESIENHAYQRALVEMAPQSHNQSARPHNSSSQPYYSLPQPEDPSAQSQDPWLQPQDPHAQPNNPRPQRQDSPEESLCTIA
ncbi:hypothetical protein EV356DRAFT_34297 [Viridothelium virens]|uniref:Uncharacterized protein n=1 Tax=Viridothelium virens TaxID=1048519 RepID=A0A6A6GT97_VIRVR|nr:hypothetical protein EV356DRAFT_34297 [Viridothelium virens]